MLIKNKEVLKTMANYREFVYTLGKFRAKF